MNLCRSEATGMVGPGSREGVLMNDAFAWGPVVEPVGVIDKG